MSYTLLEQIKIRLRQFTVVESQGESTLSFNKLEENFILNELIEKAKIDVKNARHYPATWSDEKISDDLMTNQKSHIIDLVLYDYSMEGADYESNHSENGTNRTYISRDKIIGRIVPFANILL